MNLTGTGVALVTPFKQDKSIDFESLGRVIDHCINGGVNYLIALGTTGETVTISANEKQEILSFIKKYTNGRVPLVAGFGGNNTALIIDKINRFDLSGYQAILSSSPNYNKPTQEGIYQHYSLIAKNSPLPIILYNVPSRTGQNVCASTTIRLANDHQNIIGTKEAANDMIQAMKIAAHTPSSFQLVSGDDAHALPLFSIGSVGVISVVAQAIPSNFTKMVRLALKNQFKEAFALQKDFLPLIELIFEENNPGGIKEALAYFNLCENEMRLPLVPISNSLSERINLFLKNYTV